MAKLGGAPYTPEATTWVKTKNCDYSQAEGGRISSRGVRRLLADLNDPWLPSSSGVRLGKARFERSRLHGRRFACAWSRFCLRPVALGTHLE